MTDYDGFEEALLKDPGDLAARAAYADFARDRGDDGFADWLASAACEKATRTRAEWAGVPGVVILPLHAVYRAYHETGVPNAK